MDRYHEIVWEDTNSIILSPVPWELLRGKTVLITGANGGVPSYIVYTLMALNTQCQYDVQVLALVRNEERAQARFSDILSRKDFTLLVQDVSESVNIDGPIDFIIHAASDATLSRVFSQPVDILSSNLLGTYRMSDLALSKKGAVVLYISSIAVYGYIWSDASITEKHFTGIDCMDIRYCYIEAKRAGEMLCEAYYTQYQLPVTSVRLGTVLVPGLSLEKGSLVAEFTECAATRCNIMLKSSGQSLRTYIPICDVISGIFYALLKGVRGEAYNVAHKKCIYSILDMARLFMRLSGSMGDVIVEKQEESKTEFKEHHFCIDGTKLELLGWKPSCNVEKAVYNMIEVARVT
ncbi:MAG: NAD(P)-dependent oxidoreductase [Prevotella sp.]|jgi:nucleoside-diphosphate-sugar epimerase|nr:NAD(P)-dependent oxidoreductase [Prevotella sp.]